MDVEFAFLCDSAAAGRGGKVDALGIGIRGILGRLPLEHLQIVFIARLRFELDECDREQEFIITLLDPDGDEIQSVVRQQTIPRPAVGAYGTLALTAQFQCLKFTKHGPHAVRLDRDGSEELSLDFEVGPPPT